MKVLLFVQNEGDKRPKARKSWPQSSGLTRACAFAEASRLLCAYWIVECENAEMGRAVIKLYGDFSGEAPVGAVKRGAGRILASGGRK